MRGEGPVRERDHIPLTTPSQRKPLTGVRIIDAGNLVVGPFATVLLADFGADVIKIEHPKYGDGQRWLGPIRDGIPLWWKVIARNKRCITLNLSKPQGADLFKDLVRRADVVVENYRPGTFERWGIGYDVLRQVNSQLIFLRVSGYGQTGPYKNRPGFGRVAEAMGGLSNLIGEPDGPPMTPGYPLGDLISGIFGAYAVMVALYHRDFKKGEGQVIDLALYEAVFRMLEFDPILYDQLQTVHRRTGNQVTHVAPSSTYKTRDGHYVTLAASTQSIWLRLCQAMGREDLKNDPKFVDNPLRLKHSAEINGIVGNWVSERSRNKVEDAFDRHEVAYSFVYNIEDIFNDIHFRAREMLVRVPDDELGEAVVQNVVPKFSRTPGSVDYLGPRKGSHNDEIYRNMLGYPEERIRQLRDAGII